MPENPQSHQPEPSENDTDGTEATPVPNRRERRGGKSGAQSQFGGKSVSGHRSGPAVNPRQYSTRRRGG
jgi:hypothetical protein